MKSLEEIKDLIHKHKDEIRGKYGVKEIGIFGSYVKGRQCEASDLDILIELEKPMGFIRFLKLEKNLSDMIGIKVDLVTKNALKPYIGQRILKEISYV